MAKCFTGAVVFALAVPGMVAAQGTAPAAPQSGSPTGQTFTLAAGLVRGYQGLQRNLLEAAEKMPDAEYGFRPTPDIRPFGQLVSDIAISQFGGCAVLKGEPSPQKDVKEDAPRTKAEQIALLKASAAYCDPVITTLTDETALSLVKSGLNNQVARGLVVTSTNVHGNEVYGTMAVYLRLKGLVPPTTERQSAPRK